MTKTTASQTLSLISLAYADCNRDRVYSLTSYAEQESAYSLDGDLWGYVARKGRNALVALDTAAAEIVGRKP